VKGAINSFSNAQRLRRNYIVIDALAGMKPMLGFYADSFLR